ncbi:hypothetical protein ACFVT5_09295 [Streptomyces sp. NPDC058001]|uniref:hypothetical protein n=1 Tax=Streptomyces sp. NPDC058001 TaxID=3346300 RepID=UPI0036E8B897
MGERERAVGKVGAVGCLVGVVAVGVGLTVWYHGARPGLYGAFEGERDWSLLYAGLPLMLLGIPALTFVVWALTSAALRGRAATGTRVAAAVGTAVATLIALAWGGHEWLAVWGDGATDGPI